MITHVKNRCDLLQMLGFAEPKYLFLFLFLSCTRPWVETNGYVREGKALSSCADASYLPREDGVDVTANGTLIRTVQLGHGVARTRSPLFPGFIKVSEAFHFEDLDTFLN